MTQEKVPRKPVKTKKRVRLAVTPELLANARLKLAAWQKTENSQQSILRALDAEIEQMRQRGASANDILHELGALGINITAHALKQHTSKGD